MDEWQNYGGKRNYLDCSKIIRSYKIIRIKTKKQEEKMAIWIALFVGYAAIILLLIGQLVIDKRLINVEKKLAQSKRNDKSSS